jgi:hypothetical protein
MLEIERAESFEEKGTNNYSRMKNPGMVKPISLLGQSFATLPVLRSAS